MVGGLGGWEYNAIWGCDLDGCTWCATSACVKRLILCFFVCLEGREWRVDRAVYGDVWGGAYSGFE